MNAIAEFCRMAFHVSFAQVHRFLCVGESAFGFELRDGGRICGVAVGVDHLRRGMVHSVRTQAWTLRIQRLSLGSKQFLARVLFSDSHALNAQGRNAAGDKKVTRLKMDTPSFDALRIALEDSDARIRIEDLIPPSIPYILGVKFSGGFLDGQAIHLGPNLNCIIGGRGTGKSMTFEAIRRISGQASGNSIVDSEV